MPRQLRGKVRFLFHDPENGLAWFAVLKWSLPFPTTAGGLPRSHVLSHTTCHKAETLVLKLEHQSYSLEIDLTRVDTSHRLPGDWVTEGHIWMMWHCLLLEPYRGIRDAMKDG